MEGESSPEGRQVSEAFVSSPVSAAAKLSDCPRLCSPQPYSLHLAPAWRPRLCLSCRLVSVGGFSRLHIDSQEWGKV